MEIPPSFLFLCLFSTLSVAALIPLRVLVTKVDEFSNHASRLQQILHTFSCFSVSYGFLFNPSLRLHGRDSGIFPPVWCYPYLTLMLCCAFLNIAKDPEENLFFFALVLIVLKISFLATFIALCSLLDMENWNDSGTISTSIFHWLAWVICIGLTSIIYDKDHIIKIEFDNPFVPYVVGPTGGYLLFLHQSKSQSLVSIRVPLWIKIVVGIVGNILANHYLKDKGYPLFWLIVCFAIFLMGNIVMLQSTCHTAIFGFLVGAIVDIAGEIFGLGIYMWLVGGACAALLVFFNHLDEFNRRYPGADEEKLSRPRASLELPRVRRELLRKHVSTV